MTNKDKYEPFDLDRAKKGEPIVAYIYGNQETRAEKVYLIGATRNGKTIYVETQAGFTQAYGPENLRMAPKPPKKLYLRIAYFKGEFHSVVAQDKPWVDIAVRGDWTVQHLEVEQQP